MSSILLNSVTFTKIMLTYPIRHPTISGYKFFRVPVNDKRWGNNWCCYLNRLACAFPLVRLGLTTLV